MTPPPLAAVAPAPVALAPADRLRVNARAWSSTMGALDVDALLDAVVRSAPADASYELLRELLVHRAAALTFEAPEHASLAARFLAEELREEAAASGAERFVDGIAIGWQTGRVNERLFKFINAHAAAFERALKPERDALFAWFGLKTLADRYLLRHPSTGRLIETPQAFFMRVAAGVSDTLDDALDLYERFSLLEVLPSSPTLFNAGTAREQLSSCFLLDSPADDLDDIYKRYHDIARLSKFAGGIGLAYSRVRSAGSHIKGTNGKSNGIVPFLKTLDASVAAVNQGGRRKGACCVYLEPWHADVERFLELRDNTGDEAARTHNLNLANWIPDLFMKRVDTDGMWSLFDPKEVPELTDLYGDAFDAAYVQAEKAGKAMKQVKARDLYARMMRTLAQTGNGWMCFKDKSNLACNQAAEPGRVVHLSNLCTEIIEITNSDECAVCNLASVNLARHVSSEGVDWQKLAVTVRSAVRQLDRVIDRNLYMIPEASRSNLRWRPVGLGMMGLQDVFFTLRLPFDSPEARLVSRKISEVVYFHAVKASAELAAELGAHEAYDETWAARGKLQPDLWGVQPGEEPVPAGVQLGLFGGPDLGPRLDWSALRADVAAHGLRNSLLIAIAPTATIASIVGVGECIEPQVSNLFKRETLSGEFLQVNRFLVEDLRRYGLWTPEVRAEIKARRGSVQTVEGLPEDTKRLYRTAWELSMKALIDLAADRGPYIDQSQSLNLFVEQPTIGKLSSMYMYAWKAGLKTTYYMRSRPASEIATTASAPRTTVKPAYTAEEAVTCSLENPEACEACQ